MARKKKGGTVAMVIGAIVVLGIFAYIVYGGGGSLDVDYSAYGYSDEEVDKPSAAHVITEYSDFQCPFCASTAPVLKQVKADFDVRVEYKHFPLNSIHPYAQGAAEASECARDQGRFWAFHDVLFDNQDFIAKGYLKKHAVGLGLDTEAFNTCLDKRQKQTVVAQHSLEGQRIGVQGTPTLLLDGEVVGYRSYDDFAAVLS